jgi:hypothetical protein
VVPRQGRGRLRSPRGDRRLCPHQISRGRRRRCEQDPRADDERGPSSVAGRRAQAQTEAGWRDRVVAPVRSPPIVGGGQCGYQHRSWLIRKRQTLNDGAAFDVHVSQKRHVWLPVLGSSSHRLDKRLVERPGRSLLARESTALVASSRATDASAARPGTPSPDCHTTKGAERQRALMTPSAAECAKGALTGLL